MIRYACCILSFAPRDTFAMDEEILGDYARRQDTHDRHKYPPRKYQTHIIVLNYANILASILFLVGSILFLYPHKRAIYISGVILFILGSAVYLFSGAIHWGDIHLNAYGQQSTHYAMEADIHQGKRVH